MSIFIGFLQFLFLAGCILLILVILLQRPREQGLGAAMGGDMAENFMGAGASDTLVRITVWLGGFFFVMALVIALLFANYQAERNAGVMGDAEVGLSAEETAGALEPEAVEALEEDAAAGAAPMTVEPATPSQPADIAEPGVQAPVENVPTPEGAQRVDPESVAPGDVEQPEAAAFTTEDAATTPEESADASEETAP